MRCLWVVALVASGCIEYRLKSNPEPADPVDSGVVDTAPTDTGEPLPTEPEDSATTPFTEPIATAPIYANTTDTLYEVNPETGEKTMIGVFQLGGQRVEQMVDIAIDTTGRMYGGTYDALYQIDPSTAALSKVCDTDLSPFALAFTSENVLFAGAGADIVRVDLRTCARVALGVTGGYETSGDLVGLPDGFLYWTVRGEENDALVRVDPITGAAFWVGDVVQDRLFGLGYENGQLYGFSANGEIVRIDPNTAESEQIDADRATPWWGATTNPVVW